MEVGHFGVMNALRTGNPCIDIIVAMLIPVFITAIGTGFRDVWAKLKTWVSMHFPTQTYTRTVVYYQITSPGCITIDSHEELTLQDAIMRHVSRADFSDILSAKVTLQKIKSDSDAMRVVITPPDGTWVAVEDVEFMSNVVETKTQSKKGPITNTTTTMQIRGDKVKVDAFIELAYKVHAEYLSTKDHNRYFYMQQTGDEGPVKYKRYVLSGSKTFDNLFFPQKKDVLHLLDNFTNKTGKFSSTSYPEKLGFLLHGPPGTGKTSMIKAIAKYTNRHIVPISLHCIKTNQELMDMMCDRMFPLLGSNDKTIPKEYSEILFVMEDVDAAGGVVNKRTHDDDDSDEEDDTYRMPLRHDKLNPATLKPKKRHDKLNLAGLLNAIDGVIDTPGRMLIMTSNHPEKLDPALIRPGRINMQILMDYMRMEEMTEMIESMFQCSLTSEQRETLKRVYPAMDFMTPATLENMCSMHNTVDALLHEFV